MHHWTKIFASILKRAAKLHITVSQYFTLHVFFGNLTALKQPKACPPQIFPPSRLNILPSKERAREKEREREYMHVFICCALSFHLYDYQLNFQRERERYQESK